MTILRPLQRDAIDGLRAQVSVGKRRVLLVAPCGFGKTVTIAAITTGHLAASTEHRVLVVVHRRELVRQTVAKLHAAGVDAVGVVQADTATTGRVVVASLQTLAARGARPPATLVIWDEAHHCPAVTFRDVHASYPDALHIGATATPARADGAPLGDMFEAIHVGATVRQLTALGLLVPSEVLVEGEMSQPLVAHPVDVYQRRTPNRPAVVFAASVAHARQLAEEFRGAGESAACVDGEMGATERDEALADFAAGRIDIVTNVFCLTEGWDAPRAEVCILARAPEHVGTWLQMIGRVLRPSPETGKTIATVLDLRGSSILHGLPDEDRAWSLVGAACRRTEKITALQRCRECLAVFRPARKCPRCGAERSVLERLPRVLNRAEKLERLNDLSPQERERRALFSLVSRLRRSPKYQGATDERLMRVATFILKKKKAA